MAQYDLFADPAGNGYLLDVQNDLLEGLNVRAVVPLLPQGNAPIAARADRTQSGSRCEPDWVRESALKQIDRADSRGQWEPIFGSH